VFCEKAKDNLEHYVGECEKTKTWFRELGCENREILELWEEHLDSCKGKILRRLCREREKRVKDKKIKAKREAGRMRIGGGY